MDGPQLLDGQLSEALWVEMIRAGVVPVEVVERVARIMEHRATTAGGPDEAERFTMLAAMASGIALEAQTSSPIDFTADQRRRDIRNRTAWLERQSDGGNPD